MLFLEKVDQKKVYIILVLLVSMLIGGLYSLIFVPKTQVASTTLMCLKVEKSEDGTMIKNSSTLELNDKMVANFEEIAKSQLTIDDANKDINMNVKSNQIKFTKVSNSDTFNIELKNLDKEKIIEFSNSLIDVFSKKVEGLVGNVDIYVVDTPHIKTQTLGSAILYYPLFGLLVGFGISILYIIVLISLDKKIKNSKEIETELALKNLCYIPVISKKKNVELIYNERTQPEFSNIFNTLRANIQFVNVNNKNKNTILITSPKKDEGKSFVAVNLAAAFAQIGKKVILIDADMNLGRLDKIFNVPNGLGFSNYLANLDDNGLEINELVNKYIKETGIRNLNLITSGTVPPNSAELLASPRLEQLIKDLTVFYDVVILDGASALIRTDSLILARNINSTILVSNLNKTDKDDLWQVKKDIQNVGGRIIGNVLNKTRDKQLKLRVDPTVTKIKHKHSKQDIEKVIFKVKEKLIKFKDMILNMINKSGQKLLGEAKGKEIIEIPVAPIENESNTDVNNVVANVPNNINANEVINQNVNEVKETKENPIAKLGSDVKGMFKNFNLLNAAKGFWGDDDAYVQEERVLDPKKVQETQDNINQDEFKFENSNVTTNENNMNPNVPNEVKDSQSNVMQPQELFNDIYEKSKVVLDKSKETINSFSDRFKGLFVKKEIPEVDVTKIDEAVIKANQELNKSINAPLNNEERKVIDDIELSKESEEEKEKNRIAEDLRNNEDSVLVLLDGENGMCRVFNKYCCFDKPVRGIDSVDGIEKANYSAYVLKKYGEKLIRDFGLTQNQLSRIDILIYLTLKDYDDKIWLKRKITSNTAEDYVRCMSINYEYGIGETELGYIRRCQDSRRNELRRKLIEIEYKLDNMWASKKMTITDKVVLNRFAGNFDCDNKLKLFRNELVINDKKESKGLKEVKNLFVKAKNKVIDLREKYLKINVEQVEVKTIEELQKELEIEQQNKNNNEEVNKNPDNAYFGHLYDTYNYDEPALNFQNTSPNMNSSLNYNKEEADRLREIELLKEKKKEEKAILKKMKAEERKAKKIERLKRREEQRKNKELEKEKHKKEVRIEEELLGDNLYPKTKNNKDI